MIAGDTKSVPVLGALGGIAFNVGTVMRIDEADIGLANASFYAAVYGSLQSSPPPGLISRLSVQQHGIFGWPNPPASLSIVKLESGGEAATAPGALVAGGHSRGTVRKR